jgi:hypothetical protein
VHLQGSLSVLLERSLLQVSRVTGMGAHRLLNLAWQELAWLQQVWEEVAALS